MRVGLALVLLALLAGCGGEGEKHVPPRLFTSRHVIDVVQRRTGVALVRVSRLEHVWEVLEVPDGDDPQNRLGAFSVYVLNRGALESARRVLLTSDTTNRLMKPDAEGIYWENQGDGTWIATKQYAANVYAYYVLDRKSLVGDAFDRVDSALSDL